MNEPEDSPEAIWWREKAQKGRSLVEDIKAVAVRARAAALNYILDLAAAELWKDIEKEDKPAKE